MVLGSRSNYVRTPLGLLCLTLPPWEWEGADITAHHFYRSSEPPCIPPLVKGEGYEKRTIGKRGRVTPIAALLKRKGFRVLAIVPKSCPSLFCNHPKL